MRHDYPLTFEVPKGWRGDATAGQEARGTAAAYARHCEGKLPFLNDKLSDQVALISLLELLLAESSFPGRALSWLSFESWTFLKTTTTESLKFSFKKQCA